MQFDKNLLEEFSINLKLYSPEPLLAISEIPMLVEISGAGLGNRKQQQTPFQAVYCHGKDRKSVV